MGPANAQPCAPLPQNAKVATDHVIPSLAQEVQAALGAVMLAADDADEEGDTGRFRCRDQAHAARQDFDIILVGRNDAVLAAALIQPVSSADFCLNLCR